MILGGYFALLCVAKWSWLKKSLTILGDPFLYQINK